MTEEKVAPTQPFEVRIAVVTGDSHQSSQRFRRLYERLAQCRPEFQLVSVSWGVESLGPTWSRGPLPAFAKGQARKEPPEPFDSTVLSEYVSLLGQRDFQETRFVALKLLNRLDTSGTFRFLDREIVFQHALLRIINEFRNFDPAVIVFEVTPHEFGDYLCWAVARWLGVKVLFFQPSSIAPAMIARTSLTSRVESCEGSVGSSPLAPAIIARASERLSLLAAGQDPRYMEIQQQRDSAVRSIRQRLRALVWSARWLRSDRFPFSVDFSGHAHTQGLVSRATKLLLGRSLERSLRKAVLALGQSSSSASDFCVFALHYEPERTSLPEGLPIDFQGDAVAIARSLMPDDVALVVKEHYSQQTAALRGFLGRSTAFYGLVKSLANTEFASTTERLSDLICRARCVFTLTGTVAIEAVFRGIPVAYFGSPWWSGLPGTMRIRPDASFGDIVGQRMPTKSEVSTFLENLVREAMVPGLASEPAATVEKRMGLLPEGFFEAEALSIALCIEAVVDQPAQA